MFLCHITVFCSFIVFARGVFQLHFWREMGRYHIIFPFAIALFLHVAGSGLSFVYPRCIFQTKNSRQDRDSIPDSEDHRFAVRCVFTVLYPVRYFLCYRGSGHVECEVDLVS